MKLIFIVKDQISCTIFQKRIGLLILLIAVIYSSALAGTQTILTKVTPSWKIGQHLPYIKGDQTYNQSFLLAVTSNLVAQNTTITDSSIKRNKGYFNHSSLALLLSGGREAGLLFPSLTMVHGYQFNTNFSSGLGIGYEHYAFSIMPVFAELNYMLDREAIIPFTSLRFGGSIPLQRCYQDQHIEVEQHTYGGAMLAVSVGTLFPLGKRKSMSISLGYHYQELSYKNKGDKLNVSNLSEIDRKVILNYNRIEFRAGLFLR